MSPRTHVRVLQEENKSLKEKNDVLEKECKNLKAHPVMQLAKMVSMKSAGWRTLGTAKYRFQSIVSIDTLWLITFGIAAGVSPLLHARASGSSATCEHLGMQLAVIHQDQSQPTR